MPSDMTFPNQAAGTEVLIDGWKDRVVAVCSGFENFLKLSEEEILGLGKKLHEIRNQARRISKTSLDVARKLAGEEISRAGEELVQSIDQLKSIKDYSTINSQLLMSIASDFRSVQKPLNGFQQKVMMLNALGVMIRIMDAQYGANQFQTVAENARRMAGKIRQQSDALYSRSEETVSMIRGNMKTLKEFENRYEQRTGQIMSRVTASLQALMDRQKQSLTALQDISGQYDRIFSSINEVVSSIQFHDIMRQRIVHVQEALQDAASLLTGIPADADKLEPGQHCETVACIKAERICLLQEAQMAHTREEFNDAVSRTRNHLQQVAGHIANITAETAELAGNTGDISQGGFLLEIEKGLVFLVGELGDFAQISRGIASVASNISLVAREVTVSIQDMKVLGIEMRIMALNAQISAVQSGEAGIAVGVLAREIQQLAVTTQMQINEIAGHLGRIASSAKQLEEGCLEKQKEQQQDFISAKVERTAGILRRVGNECHSMVGDIRQEGESLGKTIAHAVEDIHIHETMNRIAGETLHKLAGMRRQVENLIPAEERLQLETDLASLEARYTMNQERDIHKSLFQSDSADSGMTGLDQETVSVAAADDGKNDTPEDFGDNVELF